MNTFFFFKKMTCYKNGVLSIKNKSITQAKSTKEKFKIKQTHITMKELQLLFGILRYAIMPKTKIKIKEKKKQNRKRGSDYIIIFYFYF